MNQCIEYLSQALENENVDYSYVDKALETLEGYISNKRNEKHIDKYRLMHWSLQSSKKNKDVDGMRVLLKFMEKYSKAWWKHRLEQGELFRVLDGGKSELQGYK